MSLLIIHCPVRPLFEEVGTDGGFNSQKEAFEWCLCETSTLHATIQSTGTGPIESMPYADEALVLMQTLDVRLIEKKVPLVKVKKLQQVLPSLIEDELLGGTDNALIYALPPLAGKSGSERTLAVMNRSWFRWLAKELDSLLSPRVRMIPDCLILPLQNATFIQPASPSSCLAFQRNDASIIYTWHQADQIGVAWIDDSEAIMLPSQLEDIQPIEWSWDWMASRAFAFSRNKEIASASLNLLLADNLARKSSKKSALPWFAHSENDSQNPISNTVSWLDHGLWVKPIRWAQYAMGSMILGVGIYTSWLAIDNWRWGRNMEISAAQFLTPETINLIAQNKNTESITQAFTKQSTNEARLKGLPTDADFTAMAGKLQQLKVALGKGSIEKMDYDGYRIDFEFKHGGDVLSSADIIAKAQSLGLKLTDLGNNRYRLQPYAGLGSS
ncbi:hypothetical protein ICN41_04485 [Polynucleobacter sp. 15G-AUS-farblos]|uniref:type II secretion system protein GspL n=1 Tax=Polynucleobacter sp. 15G-AUS-farblos TaxID=2689094 RepID=UPI001C0C8232|nr:type II secretion system protein GspL [Polynucleobacter sp. 15G-AUS-farblos]MBU3583246.1 hypothetical protein [Polynucleobacter sp. 15G-AUS-farblos]